MMIPVNVKEISYYSKNKSYAVILKGGSNKILPVMIWFI